RRAGGGRGGGLRPAGGRRRRGRSGGAGREPLHRPALPAGPRPPGRGAAAVGRLAGAAPPPRRRRRPRRPAPQLGAIAAATRRRLLAGAGAAGGGFPADPRPGRLSGAGSAAMREYDSAIDDPALYFNRELSWLDFNQRVLELAEDPQVPLLERV